MLMIFISRGSFISKIRQDKMTVSYEASRKSKKLDSYFEEKESD